MVNKWWDRDPRDMTPLEFVHSPISMSRATSRRTGQPRPYQYYDTPDGQDCWKKMWVVTKWGFGTGAFLGVIDVRMYSNPPTFLSSLNRFAFYVVPITSMFATYGAITYAATSLRGKDDPLNSALGGVIAGSLAGVWLKNGQVGLWGAILTGLFCAARSHTNQLGHVMFNPMVISQVHGDWRNPDTFDTSMTPIGNKGWTTGK